MRAEADVTDAISVTYARQARTFGHLARVAALAEIESDAYSYARKAARAAFLADPSLCLHRTAADEAVLFRARVEDLYADRISMEDFRLWNRAHWDRLRDRPDFAEHVARLVAVGL